MKKRKLQAFEMEFNGYTRREIETKTRYRENTLNAYFAKNGLWYTEYRKWSSEYGEELHQQVKVRIIRASIDAVNVLVESMRMSHESPSVALRAAIAILDYAGFSRDDKHNAKEDSFEDKAEYMMRRFEEWQEKREQRL